MLRAADRRKKILPKVTFGSQLPLHYLIYFLQFPWEAGMSPIGEEVGSERWMVSGKSARNTLKTSATLHGKGGI